MDGNYRDYNYIASSSRIAEILDQPAGQFEETDSLPNRDRLTFTNGFYGYCAAVFVDIRDSSGLTRKHTRPVLAKIYRAFISEMVAVLNSFTEVREVSIVGDCVWGVYNTPVQTDIDEVFSIAYTANTLNGLLNLHLKRRNYEPIAVGIGADYGRALMVKAGYNGSGINEVVYMGDVVNRSAHLAHRAGRAWSDPIWLGSVFANNLNEHNSSLVKSRYDPELGTVYTGSVIRTDMNDWVGAQDS